MDDMMLTIEQGATAFAGTNTEACSNVAIALSEATAENYTSVEWTTTGDGTFNDITLMNPESGEDNQINYDQTYTAEDASVENYNSVSWTTSGDGTFDDENSVNPTYTPGTNDIEAMEVVLTMTATNVDCGDVSDDMTLAISPMGVYENLANFDVAIFPNPNTGQFSIEFNGNSNEIVNISLYNSLGDVVYKAENVRINNSYSETLNLDVEQGIYYLRIEGKELLLNKKIIIQK
jgi:hypothetical protein